MIWAVRSGAAKGKIEADDWRKAEAVFIAWAKRTGVIVGHVSVIPGSALYKAQLEELEVIS